MTTVHDKVISQTAASELYKSIAARLAAGATGQGGAALPPAQNSFPRTNIGDPALDEPELIYFEDFEALLAAAHQKVTDALKNSEMTGVDAAHQQRMRELDRQLQAMKEAAALHKQQKKGGLLKKIFGWIEKIAMVVAAAFGAVLAAAASPFTGGATIALTALSCVLLATAVMDLASAISQERGGPDIGLTSNFAKGFAAMLQSCGVSESKAKEVGGYLVMATMFAMTIGLMVFTGGASASKAVKAAKDAAKNAMGKVASKLPQSSKSLAAGGSDDVAAATGRAANSTPASPQPASNSSAKSITGVDASSPPSPLPSQATAAPSTGGKASAERLKFEAFQQNSHKLFGAAAMVEGGAMVVQGGAAAAKNVVGIDLANTDFEVERKKQRAMLAKAVLEQLNKDIENHVERIKELYAFSDEFFRSLMDMMDGKNRSRSAVTANIA